MEGVLIHDMRDTNYVILGKQFPFVLLPLKNNNQLFFGVAKNYVIVCRAYHELNFFEIREDT